MRTSWIPVALAAALLVVAPQADGKIPPCPGGRYLVAGMPLGGAPGAAVPDVVDVAGRMVGLHSGGCAPAKGRVRGTRKGTKVRVRWKACEGLAGKAILNGMITGQCQTLAGTFVARVDGINRPFVAALSRCGDGIWDPAAGEQCDAGLGACGDLCTACTCGGATTTTTTPPGGGTTSTTSGGGGPTTTSTTFAFPTTSTTTLGGGPPTTTSTMPSLPTTSTTTTTLPGADLRPNGGWFTPSSAPSGGTMLVQFSVRNFGTATATGPWYDYVLISHDTVVGGDQAIAVVERASNLNASSSYSVSVQATLPPVSAGTYYVYAHVDGANAVGETAENNNMSGFIPVTITAP
jgi:hypothetical protein